MKLKKVWQKEVRKRQAHELRKDRINRNWPFHAERSVKVFREFALEAEKDGVHVSVIEPEWRESNSMYSGPIGEFVFGTSSVHMRLGAMYTGDGVLTRTPDGEQSRLNLEKGSELVILHTPFDGVITVFFRHPLTCDEEAKEPLLFCHTRNTDIITDEWLTSLISAFLTFHRCESRLQKASIIDSMRMRWWLFTDIRNRRGYLDKFQHILTPWELIPLAVLAAIPSLAIIQWIWNRV